MIYEAMIRRTRHPPKHDGVFIINKHLKTAELTPRRTSGTFRA